MHKVIDKYQVILLNIPNEELGLMVTDDIFKIAWWWRLTWIYLKTYPIEDSRF